MSEYNPRLKRLVLEVVDSQIRDNNPPETKATLERLMKSGYSRKESREMIGAAIAMQIWEIMVQGVEFDETKYCLLYFVLRREKGLAWLR